MKVFSVFTGAGGFELAKPENWKITGFSEIEKNACAILKYHYPDVKNYGNIEEIRYKELPDFDMLWGGSPCQDVSVAGGRKGLTGNKSRLFFDYAEILKEKKPRYFIFENVAGLLSSNQGRDFTTVLSEFSKAGYDNIWWQNLDAPWFGIPQHRERIFVLGTLGEQRFREILFSRPDGRTDNELQPKASYKKIENCHFSPNQINRIYGTGGIAPTLHRNTGGRQIAKIQVFTPAQTQARKIYGTEGIAPTLDSIAHGGIAKKKIAIPVREVMRSSKDRSNGRKIKTHNEPSFTIYPASKAGVFDGMKVRYLTPLECERLMGWPDEHTKYGINDKGEKYELSNNARYNLIGNGVVPQMVKAIINDIMIYEDDPECLSKKELNEIKASLKDYAEGRFKSGSIADLINDLDT